MDSRHSLHHLPFYQMNDANRHDHPDHHTDNDDEAESQMKRIPDDYFNGHRRPVLVNKNNHQKQ
jgi:hypothetical protein